MDILELMKHRRSFSTFETENEYNRMNICLYLDSIQSNS